MYPPAPQPCLFPFTHRGYNVTNCVDVAGVAACPTPYGWQACGDSYEVRWVMRGWTICG